MKISQNRKFHIVFFCMMLLAVVFSSWMVQAADRTGSVKLHLKPLEHSKSVSDVTFRFYQIGTMHAGDLQPILDEKYGVELPKTAEECDAAAEKILPQLSKTPDYSVKTNATGNAELTDIEEGVYLVVAENTEEYGTISPFFLLMPVYDNMEKAFDYEIEVEPKAADIEPPPSPEPPSPNPPSPNPPKVEPPKNPPTPPNKVTGDSAPITQVEIIMLLALLVIVVLVIGKQKSKE